ncbi:hypothetical protein Fmac_027336 [Flemingia macrophylla]|uniref:EndoU domain-containing protein n=1 Tax=Flemingia macrophylla TaxID=520843 RepID=A0ABD1LHG2_9FABA
MDDLIKGLIDVTIGGGGRREEDRRDPEEERGDRSWATVVSGEDDDQPRPHHQQQQHQWSKERWEGNDQSYSDYDRDHRCSKQSRPQHSDYQSENVYPSNKPDEDEDPWETVGHKHPKRTKVPKENWNSYKQPLDEQEYSNEVNEYDVEPSRDELADLSRACERLWDLDSNRLIPNKDYQIDCGEGKKVHQQEDMAQESLFTWVSDDVFRRPTFSRFLSLLDNYNPHQGSKEVVTSEERQEQAAFIEEISRTAPIKYLYKYLASKNHVSGNYQEFKRMMTNLWFDLYGRGGTSASSSAFEHVFVGEIKQDKEVSGFHNWLQFYLEETKGNIDYQGYIWPRRRGEIPDSETQLLTIQFEWNGVLKSVSSTLVGVSPEFEIALYTLCFYFGGEDNRIQLGPYNVNIKCYRLGDRIGSVFPIAEC